MNDKEQAEFLMNELLPFAEEMLSQYQGFHPFGGYLNKQGKVVHVGVDPGREASTSREKIDTMECSFKRLASEQLAIVFAVVTDVRLSGNEHGEHDAVKIFLENETGYCADVFFCYELSGSKLDLTHTFAQRGVPRFFATIP